MSAMPTLVAILRGLEPQQSLAVAETLYETGVRCLEVPLNSPQPFESIERIAKRAFPGLTVGSGTVLKSADVKRTVDAGGSLIVSPNCDAAVIRAALELELRVMPGFATATEMFQAIAAGATELKLFPAAPLGTEYLKALGAVLPRGIGILPVGGVTADDVGAWMAAGARGFGFGSEVFKPGYALAEIETRARRLVAALNAHAS
jgi:2-dehydro-3-deoxyphosphogalactonate aldolase